MAQPGLRHASKDLPQAPQQPAQMIMAQSGCELTGSNSMHCLRGKRAEEATRLTPRIASGSAPRMSA